MLDRLLIIKLKHGNPEALQRIYEKYRLYLLKLAVALCHDVNTAEDIVHDVFIRLAQSAKTISVNGNLKSYLRTCVINDIRNKARSNKVRSHIELSQAGQIASKQKQIDHWIIIKEESMRIYTALAQIPFEQREVVILHLIADMKFREIAQSQAVSIKTIQSRYRYGLDKLRSLLNSEIEK